MMTTLGTCGGGSEADVASWHVSTASAEGSSVFLRQHDRDHSLGDRGIGRVGRMTGEGLVVIIDLEKDSVAVGFERAEIVFFIRVVGVAKIVIHRNRFDDPGDGFGAEGGEPSGHDGMAVGQVAAQLGLALK